MRGIAGLLFNRKVNRDLAEALSLVGSSLVSLDIRLGFRVAGVPARIGVSSNLGDDLLITSDEVGQNGFGCEMLLDPLAARL